MLQWQHLFNRGVREGAFDPQTHAKPSEVDISGMLEYFVEHMSHVDTGTETANDELDFALPGSHEEIMRDYRFVPQVLVGKHASRPIEDQLAFLDSTRQRLYLLHVTPFTMQCNDPRIFTDLDPLGDPITSKTVPVPMHADTQPSTNLYLHLEYEKISSSVARFE
eukprot:jgi/Hompol1/3333/HPOL_002456-RA